jgi:hypothetical protein
VVGKNENMFLTIGFCVKQNFKIVGSQIEIEKIFSLLGTFISIRRCHLQFKILDNLIFVNKNWQNVVG